MVKLNLGLLGGFRLETSSGAPVALPTRKAKALLAYLALHADQPQPRAKLAALFWEESGEAQAQASFRQTLCQLRHAVSIHGTPPVNGRGDSIVFAGADLAVDVRDFEQLVASTDPAALERAGNIYRGEFLEGFSAGAAGFENWIGAERERLREKALEGLSRLLQHYLAAGALERGIEVAQRLVALDPLRESVHRTLMELYRRQGRYGAALRQYRLCAEALAKELHVDPDTMTKALYREIRERRNRAADATASVAAPVPRPPDAAAKREQSPSQAPERRELTLMACELIGMAAFAAERDAEELHVPVAAYYRCCTDVIARYEGTLESFSGDGTLVSFAYERHAERAIRAGLDLVEAVKKLDAGLARPLPLRVGIASGQVVVGGLMGDGSSGQMLIGAAVKLALGLGSLAEPNTVVIAPSTQRGVGALFEYEALGATSLPGFGEPVAAWRVIGAGAVESRSAALRAGAPFVGRQEELDLLLRRWARAKGGGERVVVISGDAGIGKSRLVETLLERLDRDPHVRLRYFCSPFHGDSALFPIVGQLERAAGFARTDAPEEKWHKLETLLTRSSATAEEVALIAQLLSLPANDRYTLPELSPPRRREKTLEALVAQLTALAAQEPVLVVFEDAHWIDPMSLELLTLVVERVQRLPVLLLVLARTGFMPPWPDFSHVTLLSLHPLDREAGAEMIARIAGDDTLPSDVVAHVAERGEGMPLFIEELTKAVLEGRAQNGASGARPGGVISLPAIPATLHATLMGRLDRLGPAAKRIAQIGATIGRDFSYALLAAVAEREDGELNALLARLVASGLLFRRGDVAQARFHFKHELVRDAAYGSLPRGQRRELHARVAATISARFPEIVAEQPELLAQHCAEGGLVERAIDYWLAAARRALARSAMAEAEAELRKALALVPSLPDNSERVRRELDLQTALARAVTGPKGGAAASSAFRKAVELNHGCSCAPSP